MIFFNGYWFERETLKHVPPRWFQSDFIYAQNPSPSLLLSNKTTMERFRANMYPLFFSAFKGALQFLKFLWGSFSYTQNMVLNFSLLDCCMTHKTYLAHTFQHYLYMLIIFTYQAFTQLCVMLSECPEIFHKSNNTEHCRTTQHTVKSNNVKIDSYHRNWFSKFPYFLNKSVSSCRLIIFR